jgi:hypothetical protein
VDVLTIQELADCIGARWSPQIGDDSVMGWLTVVAYLVTAALALRVTLGAAAVRREQLFWGLITAAMLFLAVNKQLDLQSAFTAAGRCVAMAQGWYDDRRAVQLRFVEAMIGVSVLLLVAGSWLLWRILWTNLLALAGLAFVIGFVLVRAIGFHHVDRMIGSTIHDVRINWILEWTGLVLISINALALMARRQRNLV